MKEFKTVEEHLSAEIEEKRSKFLADIFYVENEEQAREYINSIKKKYHDAKHHTYAYKVVENGKVIERSSDDGEPSGTAGVPILNVLNGFCNVLIVVTRYFGVVLLGTGGLVRCYTEAAKCSINKSKVVEKVLGFEVKIVLTYSELKEFEYYARKNNIKITNKVYGENIEIIVDIPEKLKQEFIKSDSTSSFKFTNCDFLKEKYIDK